MKTIIAVAACLGSAVGAANAAVLNTDYYDFEGRAFIETEKLSAACTSQDLTFDQGFTVVYRFNTGTNVVADTLAFVNDHADRRVVATKTPYSLNGVNVATEWDAIDSRAGLSTDNPTTTSLTITPSSGSKIVNATNYVEIYGTLNDFLNFAGCTVTIRAGLVRRPG